MSKATPTTPSSTSSTITTSTTSCSSAVTSAQRVPEPDPATRYFFPYPTRPDSVLEIIGQRVTRKIGYYPIFRVNPKFRVLPDISGITRKRKTIPSSGALLWEPQKGPQGAKKSAKSAIFMSSMTVELPLVGHGQKKKSLFKTYDLW